MGGNSQELDKDQKLKFLKPALIKNVIDLPLVRQWSVCFHSVESYRKTLSVLRKVLSPSGLIVFVYSFPSLLVSIYIYYSSFLQCFNLNKFVGYKDKISWTMANLKHLDNSTLWAGGCQDWFVSNLI